MKLFRTSVFSSVLLVSNLLVAGIASAASPSKSLPIASLGALENNDLLLISNVESGITGQSLLQSNGLVQYYFTNYNSDGVPQTAQILSLLDQALSFEDSRPTNDWLEMYTYCFSADGDVLFDGYGAAFHLAKVNGTWSLPSGADNVTNYLGYESPIYEPGATSAEFLESDAYGNIINSASLSVTYNPTTGLGKIMFPNQYAGQHGGVVVNYGLFDQYGNETNYYQLAFGTDEESGGARLPIATAQSKVQASFGAITNIAPPNIFLTNVLSQNHVGQSPLVEFIMPSAGFVIVSGETTEGEWFDGFTLTQLVPGGAPIVTEVTVQQGAKYYVLPIGTPGVYHLDFDWPLLAPTPIYPDYGGGVTVTGGAKG